MSRLASRVVERYVLSREATFEEFERAVKAGMVIRDKLQAWADGFPRLLTQNVERSKLDGWVWSKPFWDDLGVYRVMVDKTLPALRERIEELGQELGFDYNYLNPIGNALSPEVEAPTRPIWDGANTRYLDEGGVALNVEVIEKWYGQFQRWLRYWEPVLKKALAGAKRSYKRRVR
jgi:hypothetical protein